MYPIRQTPSDQSEEEKFRSSATKKGEGLVILALSGKPFNLSGFEFNVGYAEFVVFIREEYEARFIGIRTSGKQVRSLSYQFDETF